MKKCLATIVIISIYSITLFPQSFYRYQGKRIDLVEDSSMFVIQTDERMVEKQNSTLEMKLQNGEIKSFQKISNNCFLIVGQIPLSGEYGYFSYVYRSYGKGILIILPRIVLMFKNDTILQSILNKYKSKLVEDIGSKQKYILKCDVTSSSEVLELVNELDTLDDVVWCEPEFFQTIELIIHCTRNSTTCTTQDRMEELQVLI